MCRTRTKPRTSRTPNPSDIKAAFAAVHIAIRNRLEGTLISILVVAEKPSVAMSYAKVLGATNRKDGYLEGNGYLVSWCVGHLVELAPPNVYDARYVKWSIADLPILPEKWQYLVSASTKKQFGILQKLMNRPDVDSIVNSCDSGREGELIFRLVYQQAGGKKPFSRLWLSSMEENAIREGFAHLKPSTEYDALYNAALCRERADWMVGINASRLFSCLYNQPLAVGRVMTPVLAMTVVREAAIAAFTPEKFYTVALTLADGGTASSKRFAQKADAELLLSKCRKEGRVTVQKMERKEKSESPPQLYDLTALQRDANRLLGFTAQQTLDYAQSLYEKRLITYPRTDSRFLTEDMAASLPGLVTDTGRALAVEEPFPIHVQQVINGSKVTDHHALLPTKSMANADLAALPAGERNVLRLISARLLCAVGEPHRYAETTLTTICAEEEFFAKGKVVLSDGWKAMERKMLGELLGKQKEAVVLPDAQEQKISSADELRERTAAATERYHTMGDSIKAAEARLTEIAVLKTHIINYAKTRPVYDAYRKSGYSKKYLEAHREEITLHKAAKAAFDEAGLQKLPKVKELDAEFAELLTQKKAAYPDYRKARNEMQELVRAQKNVERFFAEEKENTEKTQTR